MICPLCLPDEYPLMAEVSEETEDDILAGALRCSDCGRGYVVQEGIAYLDPATANKTKGTEASKYESAPVVSSYLWSHYGDILDDENASAAYSDWNRLIKPSSGFALDAGSAVGRFTFELSRKNDFAIGIDNSLAFIRTARELMLKREKTFQLLQEGLVTREKTITLPAGWNGNKVEFLIADAERLPFRAGSFSSVASLNLVDKLPKPIWHLKEMDRVAQPRKSQLLLSDPFSWSEDVTSRTNWLGGTHEGPYSGNGLENVAGILNGSKNGLRSQWNIEKAGHVWWKIRTHQNHFELIRSCYVKANR